MCREKRVLEVEAGKKRWVKGDATLPEIL